MGIHDQHILIITSLLSTRKPLHQQVHGDGSPCYSHRQLPKDEVDGWEYQDTYVMRRGYSETHNWDIPIHILQMPLSDNFHQKAGCALRVKVLLLSGLLSVPKLPEK